MSEFLNYTLGGWLDKIACENPDHEALVYPDRSLRYSYSRFNEECDRAAKGLMKLGIKKGEHVAIWATNYPEWVVTFFATAKIGAIMVTVNTNYRLFELEYQTRQSDVTTLIMINNFKDTNYVDIVNEMIPELSDSEPGKLSSEHFPCLKNLVYLDSDTPAGMFNWADILKMGESVTGEELAAASSAVDCHDVTTMLYTSGTTGFPKGVMLTHYNILNNGLFTGDNMQFTPSDRLLIQVPFFHCFGMILSILACVTHASTMIPLESYSPTIALKVLDFEKCTIVHGVPTMFIFIMDHPDFKKYDLSHLRSGIMAGSNCPENLMRRCADEMNMKEICSVYGQTESSPNITQSTWEDSLDLRVSTVGRATGGVEVKISDPETGVTLPPNTLGEICSRGYHIMKGYYKMEEATRQAIDGEGWLHTGDIGFRDENGYYSITGRIKDMIIRGGENIYPRELEELLYTHPQVQDVQVVGVPSKKFGEEVLAWVVLKAGEEATEEEIKDFMRKNISRHKVPSYIWFIDTFPMTASGKIQKFKLREMAVLKLSQE